MLEDSLVRLLRAWNELQAPYPPHHLKDHRICLSHFHHTVTLQLLERNPLEPTRLILTLTAFSSRQEKEPNTLLLRTSCQLCGYIEQVESVGKWLTHLIRTHSAPISDSHPEENIVERIDRKHQALLREMERRRRLLAQRLSPDLSKRLERLSLQGMLEVPTPPVPPPFSLEEYTVQLYFAIVLALWRCAQGAPPCEVPFSTSCSPYPRSLRWDGRDLDVLRRRTDGSLSVGNVSIYNEIRYPENYPRIAFSLSRALFHDVDTIVRFAESVSAQ